MPDRPRLAATSRTVTGKKVARLRHAGQLPAVVFGHGAESQPLSVDAHEFDLLRRHVGASTLVDLSVDGKKAKPVIVHGVQVHPLTRRPVHIDLFAVRMTEEITVEVPLVGTGVAPATETGGTLMHNVQAVKVKALPDHLPESLHYDLSPLTDYDHSLTIADLVVPEGVTVLADPAEVIAKVLAPRVETEEVPAAEAGEGEAAAEAPAEGEAASEG